MESQKMMAPTKYKLNLTPIYIFYLNLTSRQSREHLGGIKNPKERLVAVKVIREIICM